MFKLKMVEKPELLNLKTNVEFPPVYVQTDHSKLENLDYKNSGHIGFASSDDLEKKVDKIDGKGLSTNDYTNDEKNKLAELENYTLPIATNETLGGIKVGENLTITEDGVLSAKGGSGGGINIVEVKGQTIDLIDYEEPTIIHSTMLNTYVQYNKKSIVINNKYLSFSKNQTRALIYWSGTKFLNTATEYRPALFIVLNNAPLQIQKNNYNYTILDTIKFILLPTGKIYGELQSNNLMLQDNSETISGEKTFTALPKSSVNPTDNNHFTRKGYVDALPTTYAGYDATKTQVLKNINGTLTWVDE